jgi:hypothetical protein
MARGWGGLKAPKEKFFRGVIVEKRRIAVSFELSMTHSIAQTPAFCLARAKIEPGLRYGEGSAWLR